MTKVCPKSLFSLRNRLCNSSAFFESKFPEGSSAKMIEGELINALATATLCCSPPESSSGLWFALSLIPSNLSNYNPFCSAIFLSVPAINAGKHTFSKAVNSTNRL